MERVRSRRKGLALAEGEIKNGEEHVRLLPDDVVDILEKLPRHKSTDFLFSFDGKHAVTGFPPSKAKLDAKMKATLGGAFRPWRTHDLRRTFASGLADLGVSPHVIEACLKSPKWRHQRHRTNLQPARLRA